MVVLVISVGSLLICILINDVFVVVTDCKHVFVALTEALHVGLTR